MAKWADFVISAVRYNSQHTHIELLEVRVAPDPFWGVPMGNPAIKTRQEVVDAIRQGVTYATATGQDTGKWQKGDDVKVINVNGVAYLRTDGNSKAADNLGNLPEF